MALSLLFYIFCVVSSPSHTNPIHDFQIFKLNPKVEYFFVASLEEFLTSTSKNQRSHMVSDDIVHIARITENIVARDGVVVFSMADVPLAKSMLDCRKMDPNEIVVLPQVDIGE
ncbi:unnamed protein product [Ilex paraguariensis]|uniref:UPF0113 domain-containing protein n=1 Tax=Ilex paraguariensis TaxID=185542 RepID=A0ABC8RFN7_9AQUA